jgi:signal transduction histidine kinase
MRLWAFGNRGIRPILALLFLLWIALGTLVLVALSEWTLRRSEAKEFEMLAASNAAFLRRSFPQVDTRLASRLEEVLHLEVRVTTPAQETSPTNHAWQPPADGISRTGPDRRLWVANPLNAGQTLILIRPVPSYFRSLHSFPVWIALACLWTGSAALALVLAHVNVAPLTSLAADVRNGAPLESLPGADRNDEIGDLARGLREAGHRIEAERKRREEAERMAALGRMSASLAHELHNPLAAIRMHAELALGGSTEETHQSLGWIRTETARMERLVNQWLFLGRPDPVDKRPVSLRHVAERVAQFYAPVAAEAQVNIRIEEDAVAETLGDQRRLEQAVAAVLLNAIQAARAGEEIRIETGRKEGTAWLAVQDRGPGFSNEAVNRGTELFYSEKQGGTGIGLTVAAEIVRAHGGKLTWRNTTPGARVELSFPDA